ncbi:hypothetical protein L6R53_12370 [Myxococcota bacterium]|nr:hypothetical protein [Myxococcota bacterium]
MPPLPRPIRSARPPAGARATLALPLGLLLGTRAVAADVVLPDFTPATMDDFAAADDLGNLARMALEDRGLVVLGGEALEALVGDAALACADEVSCPVNLWGRIDASTAVVGRVGQEDGLLHVRILVYEGRGSRATRTYEERLPPAAAGELLLRVADDLAPETLAPPAVSRPVPGVVEERYAPASGAAEEPPLDEEPPRRPDRESDEQVDRLGLPAYAERRYEDSGAHADAWLEQARVRRPAVFLELHGGALMGDLDRRYDTRVGLYDELGDAWSDRDTYTYHSFLNSRGFTGGLAVGYQAAWWVDVSLLGGVQLGRKELTTGWETWEAAGNPDGTDEFLESDQVVYDPVSAVLGFMEPRVRLYPLATGILKPYVLAGFHLRFYDAYAVPDQEFVDYPEAQGGVGMGPTVGGGLAFDAPKGAVGFIEIPWTYVVSPSGAAITDTGGLQEVPTQFVGVGQFLVFKAGLGVHFH